MNRIQRFAIASAVVLFSSAAFAVDLQNQDGKKYDVKITQGATATSTSIEANTTVSNIFTGAGTVEVVGVGSVQASGDEVVVIKDGKVTKHG